MASREPKKPKAVKPLEVRVMFEPSRLAAACIVQAYERVVPVTRRIVSARLIAPRATDDNEQKQHIGGAR